MDETDLAVAINDIIKNHDGHSVNLTVKIMSMLKERELFIHNGNVYTVVEVDMMDGNSEYYSYTVYTEPIEEDE